MIRGKRASVFRSLVFYPAIPALIPTRARRGRVPSEIRCREEGRPRKIPRVRRSHGRRAVMCPQSFISDQENSHHTSPSSALARSTLKGLSRSSGKKQQVAGEMVREL